MLILLSFDLHTNKRTSCYIGECLLSFRYILMKSINNLITFSFQCIDLNTRLCKRISISYDINIFKETKAFSQIFLNAHVKIQDYNFNASSCRFVFELFICYHVLGELVKFKFFSFPISAKYAHIWIMTFLQELTAVCANHAYKSITKACVL